MGVATSVPAVSRAIRAAGAQVHVTLAPLLAPLGHARRVVRTADQNVAFARHEKRLAAELPSARDNLGDEQGKRA